MVLGGRIGQVVEDYDGDRCNSLYSDSSSALSSSVSPRPETVSALLLLLLLLLPHLSIIVCIG